MIKKEAIIYFCIKYKSNFFKVYQAIKNCEKIDKEILKFYLEHLKKYNINYITILDKKYPLELKNIKHFPYVLFYKGNIDLLNKEKIMLVGDNYNLSKKEIFNSVKKISKLKVLCTSFFKGFDQKIEQLFNQNNWNIIYFSANGLINPYFPEKILIKKSNLILSEYPFEINLSKRKLYKRNFILSILVKTLIVYNSEKNSKLFNLITYFLENGNEIFCFPPKGNDGNLSLINDGANYITKISI